MNKVEEPKKIGQIAKRLWENRIFQRLIQDAQENRLKTGIAVRSSDKIIFDIRNKMKGEGFPLSKFWENLLVAVINNKEYPFVGAASNLYSATAIRTIDRFGEETVSVEMHPETTDEDFERMGQQIKDDGIKYPTKEHPWKNFELAKKAEELFTTGKSNTQISNILNDILYPNGWTGEGTLFDRVAVVKLRTRYKKKTGNK